MSSRPARRVHRTLAVLIVVACVLLPQLGGAHNKQGHIVVGSAASLTNVGATATIFANTGTRSGFLILMYPNKSPIMITINCTYMYYSGGLAGDHYLNARGRSGATTWYIRAGPYSATPSYIEATKIRGQSHCGTGGFDLRATYYGAVAIIGA